jgi:poly(ADP-ribose) glycohydrolase ARH3
VGTQDHVGAGSELSSQVLGALLGTFVGDALGMPFEGSAPGAAPANLDMVEARLGRGTYTDDTQMMIALAESLIERGTLDEEHLARAFQSAYDPARGYGSGTRQVFALWQTGTPVARAAAQVFGGEGSRGNGAAMRIAPVAVLFRDDPARLSEEAARSARLTHAHPVGVDAAVVQAAAIGAALRGADIFEAAETAARSDEILAALQTVRELLGGPVVPTEVQRRLGTSSEAAESVPAALYTVLAHSSFESAVRFAVRLGGDTDTLAAMTGAVAGAVHGAHSIPWRWLEALEDGERGRGHVERIAVLLEETSVRRRH